MTYLKKYTGMLFVLALLSAISPLSVHADTGAEIDREVDIALQKLYASSSIAVELSKLAKGTLVYPNVIKAGLVVGGQYGEGPCV